MSIESEMVLKDAVVSLDYTLRLEDGEVIDTSEGREPLEFLQGHGQIIPGLEQALYGMKVGDERQVEVPPADGYGEHSSEAFQLVEHSVFPPDMALEVGMGLQMHDGEGNQMIAYVSEVREDGVMLDFNHPLAGQTLFFDVKIAGLRPATPEELDHGHVHGEHHHH
jgi:FKBP-type peptidyl-prolyl cis-trans isomerase SlyD